MHIQDLKRVLADFANAGYQGRLPEDQLNQVFIATLFSSVATLFLILFGIESLLSGNRHHGAALILFAAITTGNYVFLRHTGHAAQSNIAVIFLMGLLCVFLLYTGGVEGTGPLWYFVFPLVVFFISGLKTGIFSALLLLVITVILLFTSLAEASRYIYSDRFGERFISVFIAVSVMTAIYESVRVESRKKQSELNRMLEMVANTDPLTGLSNRRDVTRRLEEESHRAKRYKRTLSVVLIDVDHFKAINDTFGHDGGDHVLKTLANIMAKNLRKQDCASRWGGEEFLILLPETDSNGATIVAEKIRALIESGEFRINGTNHPVTISAGVAEIGDDFDFRRYIAIADANLYKAKENGRNRVVRE